jgi:two-component system cell cycle response regulator
MRIKSPSLRVLIVEGQPGFARLIKGFLERRRCAVIIASDGRSALEVAKASAVELVVLDLDLVDAVAVVTELTALASTDPCGHPRIFVITDRNHDDATAKRAARAGVQVFLRQPLDFALLDALLLSLWQQSA